MADSPRTPRQSVLVDPATFAGVTTYRVYFRDTTNERANGQWRLWSNRHRTHEQAVEAAAECRVGREWAATRIAVETTREEWSFDV